MMDPRINKLHKKTSWKGPRRPLVERIHPKRRGLRHGSVASYRDARLAAAAATAAHAVFWLNKTANEFMITMKKSEQKKAIVKSITGDGRDVKLYGRKVADRPRWDGRILTAAAYYLTILIVCAYTLGQLYNGPPHYYRGCQ
jgi:hypothetical protein